jgi:sigma-B regulation protein RsbU (phosphoserine phosphatase)
MSGPSQKLAHDSPPPGNSQAPARFSPASIEDLSFRARLTLAVCTLVLLTGAMVTWLAHRSAKTSTESLARSLFREVSSHAATQSQSYVLRAAPLVESLVQLADDGLALDDSDRLSAQLLSVLEANEGLSWVSYGDESGNFTGAYRPVEGGLRLNQSRIAGGRTQLVEQDVEADGSRRVHRTDNDSGYDPRTRPFYRKAKEAGRLVWLPPYVFYNQRVPGVSCAAPVYEANKKLRGVISVDFDLNALSGFVGRLAMSDNSDLFLFTSDGVLLAHPSLTSSTPGSQADPKLVTLADAGDPVIEAMQQNSNRPNGSADGQSGFKFFEFEHGGADYYASTTSFPVGDDLTWLVGAVAPKSDFLSGVWRSQALALAFGTLALVGSLLLAFALARRVSGPVQSLIGFMQRVGEGDLEAKADFAGSREFRQLSDALNRMIADLRDRLRLRHSLNVAMEVQQRLLPQRPPRPRGLDVAGHSTYCDETGGDYYDFLILDETEPDNVLVALGDVMGHGVAAALVMAGARAVLRDRAASTGSLADLMGRLNRLLAADLQGTRFMTMYLAVVNSAEGNIRWVSAGHDPAIVYDPASESFEEIDGGELPLGVMDTTEYVEQTYPLQPGQIVLVGTDGIWEMHNAAGEQFGKTRLRDAIQDAAANSAADIVDEILARLAEFRGQCRPTDDVTFVVIKALPVAALPDVRTETSPSLTAN